MAYLRKIKVKTDTYRSFGSRRAKRSKVKTRQILGLKGLTNVLLEVERTGVPIEEVEKKYPHYPKKYWELSYEYWVIEESYREGSKVKSRILYSLSKHFKNKPTKKQIKILLDKKEERYKLKEDIFNTNWGKTKNKYSASEKEKIWNYAYEEFVLSEKEDFEKLQYAYNKLNDKRWNNSL